MDFGDPLVKVDAAFHEAGHVVAARILRKALAKRVLWVSIDPSRVGPGALGQCELADESDVPQRATYGCCDSRPAENFVRRRCLQAQVVVSIAGELALSRFEHVQPEFSGTDLERVYRCMDLIAHSLVRGDDNTNASFTAKGQRYFQRLERIAYCLVNNYALEIGIVAGQLRKEWTLTGEQVAAVLSRPARVPVTLEDLLSEGT